MSSHRLAAVLFADIVGYTALMQADESAGIAKASQLRMEVETLLSQHGGKLVEMRGDGALCLFDSSTEAVRFAIKLQQSIAQIVPLRIGIHLGDITERNGHLFGDAVNIASRVESMGVAGAVLLSGSIRRQIKNKPEFRLVSLGPFSFKNVSELIEVYAVGNEGLVVPKGKEVAQQMKGRKHNDKRKLFLWVGLVLFLTIVGSLWLYSSKRGPSVVSQDLLSSDLPPSIAVMPFRDLSQTQDQGYFCDGVAEEILNRLATLEGLKVAGRTSSFSFRDRKASLEEISRTLQVSHILEGSVNRVGNQVRINTQLIDASNGFQMWSLRFDKEMTDIFQIQDEITSAIIDAFSISILTLQPELYQASNSLAYDAYLKGVHFHNSGDLSAANNWFRKAIELDPNYAQAYGYLATSLYQLTLFGHRFTTEQKEEVIQLAERGWELDSNNQEVISAKLYILHDLELAYDRAKDLQDRARNLYPSWAWNYQHMAYGGFFRQLPAEKVLPDAQKHLALDPLNGSSYAEVSFLYAYYRDWDKLKSLYQTVEENLPEDFWSIYAKANVQFYLGNYEKAYDEFLEILPIMIESRMAFYLVNYLGCLAQLGKSDELNKWAERLETDNELAASSAIIASAFMATGNREKTFHYLHEALDNDINILRFYRADPYWDELREDPEFEEIMRSF